jgi:hypothetical protein
MDKRKFNGGSRKGSGRKKGTGISSLIKKHVDDFMQLMIEDPEISKQINKDLKQLSLTSGWIYIIKDKKNGYYKIGVTQRSNPNERLSHYKTHNMDIDLIYIDNLEYCYKIESDLHELFEEKRNHRSDWFELTHSDIVKCLTEISKHKHNKCYA